MRFLASLISFLLVWLIFTWWISSESTSPFDWNCSSSFNFALFQRCIIIIFILGNSNSLDTIQVFPLPSRRFRPFRSINKSSSLFYGCILLSPIAVKSRWASSVWIYKAANKTATTAATTTTVAAAAAAVSLKKERFYEDEIIKITHLLLRATEKYTPVLACLSNPFHSFEPSYLTNQTTKIKIQTFIRLQDGYEHTNKQTKS